MDTDVHLPSGKAGRCRAPPPSKIRVRPVLASLIRAAAWTGGQAARDRHPTGTLRPHQRSVLLTRALLVSALAVASSATVLVACHARSAPRSAVVGVYDLISVNGKRLPFRTYEDINMSEDILSSTLSLDNDGTAESVTQIRMTLPDGAVPRTDQVTGTYTFDDTAVHLALGELPAVTLRRIHSELTLNTDRYSFAYRRTRP